MLPSSFLLSVVCHQPAGYGPFLECVHVCCPGLLQEGGLKSHEDMCCGKISSAVLCISNLGTLAPTMTTAWCSSSHCGVFTFWLLLKLFKQGPRVGLTHAQQWNVLQGLYPKWVHQFQEARIAAALRRFVSVFRLKSG